MISPSPHVRTPREQQLHTAISRLAVLPSSAELDIVRAQAAGIAEIAGEPETLRERAFHVVLRWVAAAPDGTAIAEVRAYASSSLQQIDLPVPRLEYWVEYSERRLGAAAAAKAVP